MLARKEFIQKGFFHRHFPSLSASSKTLRGLALFTLVEESLPSWERSCLGRGSGGSVQRLILIIDDQLSNFILNELSITREGSVRKSRGSTVLGSWGTPFLSSASERSSSFSASLPSTAAPRRRYRALEMALQSRVPWSPPWWLRLVVDLLSSSLSRCSRVASGLCSS